MKHSKRIIAIALIVISAMAIAMPAMAAVWDDWFGTGLIQYGDVGTYVRRVQIALNNMRNRYYLDVFRNPSSPFYFATLSVDGQFGPATLDAVKKVQEFFHLIVDGIVGPQTKDELWPYRE